MSGFLSRALHTRCCAVLVLAAATGLPAASALASTGCDYLNAGSGNITNASLNYFTQTFAAGDTLTVTVNSTLSNSLGIDVRPAAGGDWIFREQGIPVPPTVTRTITIATAGDFRLETGSNMGRRFTSVVWTCVAGAASTGSNSDKARAVQVLGSNLAAQTSGAVLSAAFSSAVSEAFQHGSALSAGANGLRINMAADIQGAPRLENTGSDDTQAMGTVLGDAEWLPWIELRASGSDSDHAASLKASQFNGTLGLSRKLGPDFLVGLAAGYENFDVKDSALSATLKGEGGTLAAYAGWRIGTGLQADAALAWSHLAYDATAATASGSFDADRLLFNGGLTGFVDVGAVNLQPAAHIFVISEHQDAYTDSLGAAQAARRFTVGRASLGGRMAHAMALSGSTLTPYAGAYADYRFSSDDAVPVNVAEVGLKDGWSGRLSAGADVESVSGLAAGLGGELGGLGSHTTNWSLTAHGSLAF